MSESWCPEVQKKMIDTRDRLRLESKAFRDRDIPEERRLYPLDHEEMLMYRELIKWYFNSIYGREDHE